MATTINEQRQFAEEIQDLSLLDTAIDFIKTNIDIDRVYSEDTIREWCAAGAPEDTFDEKALRGWALENGFQEVEE